MRILCVTILAAAAVVLMHPAGAQNYSNRPVRIIVPFAAGGIGDITTRLIADKLGDRLGERFIVDNQPGAGGIAAARSVLAAPADGYTLALVTNGTAINVPLFKSLPYDPVKDFAPISGFSLFDLTLVTNAGGPMRRSAISSRTRGPTRASSTSAASMWAARRISPPSCCVRWP